MLPSTISWVCTSLQLYLSARVTCINVTMLFVYSQHCQSLYCHICNSFSYMAEYVNFRFTVYLYRILDEGWNMFCKLKIFEPSKLIILTLHCTFNPQQMFTSVPTLRNDNLNFLHWDAVNCSLILKPNANVLRTKNSHSSEPCHIYKSRKLKTEKTTYTTLHINVNTNIILAHGSRKTIM